MGESSIPGKENPSKNKEKYRAEGGSPMGLECVLPMQCFPELTDKPIHLASGQFHKMKRKEVWSVWTLRKFAYVVPSSHVVLANII